MFGNDEEKRMILSYQEINNIAQGIVDQYRKKINRPCVNVDITELLGELYGLQIEYYSLSKNGAILGLYSSVPVVLYVEHKGEPALVQLQGKTALIDERLLDDKCIGRRNFTIAHEGSHYILEHALKEMWIVYRDTFNNENITDWSEWQANALASCLLMPENSIRYMFWRFFSEEHIEIITPLHRNIYVAFETMAEYFGVSKQALGIRLKKLGLVDDVILTESISIVKEN